MLKSVADGFKLSNGVLIPCVGFGTWQAEEGELCVKTINSALKAGYRHFDTAARYGNEVSVGKTLREHIANGGAKREDIFLTTKVWASERGYDKTMKAFDESLKRLGLDYVDLYLIHWPASPNKFANFNDINADTWKALVDLYKQGRVKAIGVSNFKVYHLMPLMDFEIKPMVNQIEYHPGLNQEEIVSFCQNNGIQVAGWSPLGRGNLKDHELIVKIAHEVNKSPAQVMLRWCLQHDVLPLPRSLNAERMKQNTELFDFSLSQEHMAAIDGITGVWDSGCDPDHVEW